MPTVAIDVRDAHAPAPRGPGRHARELLRALRARAGEDGLDYEPVTHGGRGPELAFEQLVWPARLRRRPPALVHAPNCFLPLRRPCPGVVTIHDLAFEAHPEDFSARTGLKYRTFTPRAARSAERVICVSQFTARDVVARYGVDPARLRVVGNAPALAVGEREPPPGPYLLAVGDLRAKKNLLRLVAAYRELRRAAGLPHRLVLAGADAGEGPRLRDAAAGLPVELTGYLADERLDALLRGADVLVHPSLYEGFGLVVVEAMARGVPVAAARATALPETGGEAIVTFDPLDVDDIAATIEAALADRAELSRRGRERASSFTWGRAARETAAVYRELL